ncbi:MAG: TetR/AcrR family transcriptional regulator [Alphaproteobacteria bacterium]|nr:TetR/AcrR family transcriptional regulator [Alphaproteobacteria bacterium]
MAKLPSARRSGMTARLIRLRRRGRRNAKLSREIILSAAQDEFVEHGLNGARVDRIPVAIGASKNLIYHYFGSKDGLLASGPGGHLSKHAGEPGRRPAARPRSGRGYAPPRCQHIRPLCSHAGADPLDEH